VFRSIAVARNQDAALVAACEAYLTAYSRRDFLNSLKPRRQYVQARCEALAKCDAVRDAVIYTPARTVVGLRAKAELALADLQEAFQGTDCDCARAALRDLLATFVWPTADNAGHCMSRATASALRKTAERGLAWLGPVGQGTHWDLSRSALADLLNALPAPEPRRRSGRRG
jgi:hypothetical protein